VHIDAEVDDFSSVFGPHLFHSDLLGCFAKVVWSLPEQTPTKEIFQIARICLVAQVNKATYR
jgi:hypothetical protein